MTWLHDHGFLVRTRRAGKTPHLQLIHHGSTHLAQGRYVQAPLFLWTDGYILTLPTRALGIYLALREASGGNPKKEAVLSGSRKSQYYLSDETWARASDDLSTAGLLKVDQVFARASPTDEYEPKRRRQRYTLIDPPPPPSSSGE